MAEFGIRGSLRDCCSKERAGSNPVRCIGGIVMFAEYIGLGIFTGLFVYNVAKALIYANTGKDATGFLFASALMFGGVAVFVARIAGA